MTACASTCPMGSPPPEGVNPMSGSFTISRLKISCQLEQGHQELHRNGPLTWHDPTLLLVGGEPVDVTSDTDRWIDGQVVLGGDAA